MWPLKRKKKTARNELKQVYYYQGDFKVLKALSKEDNRSMTQVAHDILLMYVGYKYGSSVIHMKKLELEVKLLNNEYRKVKNKLKVYTERFGEIID